MLAKPVPLFSLLISISRKSLLLQFEKMVKRVVFPHLRSTREKFPTGSEFRGELWEKREKNSLMNVIFPKTGLIRRIKTIV